MEGGGECELEVDSEGGGGLLTEERNGDIRMWQRFRLAVCEECGKGVQTGTGDQESVGGGDTADACKEVGGGDCGHLFGCVIGGVFWWRWWG